MAISKTQPMRPAEIELVDEVNRLTNASSTYSGFSYSVANTGSNDVDVRIWFLAVKVN